MKKYFKQLLLFIPMLLLMIACNKEESDDEGLIGDILDFCGHYVTQVDKRTPFQYDTGFGHMGTNHIDLLATHLANPLDQEKYAASLDFVGDLQYIVLHASFSDTGYYRLRFKYPEMGGSRYDTIYVAQQVFSATMTSANKILEERYSSGKWLYPVCVTDSETCLTGVPNPFSVQRVECVELGTHKSWDVSLNNRDDNKLYFVMPEGVPLKKRLMLKITYFGLSEIYWDKEFMVYP